MAKSFIVQGLAVALIGWLFCGNAIGQPPGAGGKDKKRPGRNAPADEPRRPDQPGRPRPDGKPPGSGEDRRPEILRKYDRNGDGRIDEDERAKLVEDMKRRGLRKEDIARQLERLAILERFDKDGDGVLNEEELAAARDAAKSDKPPVGDEPRKRPGSKKQQEMLEKYDADGDGKLSAAEKAQIQKDLKAKREEEARQRAEEKKRKKS